jgi:hypothetical protein
MPATIDRVPADDGEAITVRESGALFRSISLKMGRFLPTGEEAMKNDVHESQALSRAALRIRVIQLTAI